MVKGFKWERRGCFLEKIEIGNECLFNINLLGGFILSCISELFKDINLEGILYFILKRKLRDVFKNIFFGFLWKILMLIYFFIVGVFENFFI